MKWYKASNNLISDSELKLISHKAGVKHYVTVVTFHSLLERCSRNGSSIFTNSDTLADEISIESGIEANEIESCLSWLEKHKKIKGNMLVNWEIYQESTSTQRVREWRERKANETLHNVTNVSVTNVTQRRGEENRVEEKEEKEKIDKKKVVGSRFELTDPPIEWIEFCQTQRPDLNAGLTFDSFRDYWVGVAGAKGVKLDWNATWRNWVRGQKQTNNHGGRNDKLNEIGRALQRGLDRAY
jgi:hypothetical protein